MGFGKLLEEKMKAKGVKQAELAEAVGLPKTTLSSMITRDNTKIEIEKFLKICEYLDCNPEDFYSDYRSGAKKMPPLFTSKYNDLDNYGKELVDTVLQMEYERCIAALEDDDTEETIEIRHSIYKVSAGRGFDLDEGDYWETITIPDSPEARKADFALTIKGNSMEPVYRDGDIVLVKKQDAVDIGEICIYNVDGAGYIKKFGGDRLISLNAEYDDILLSDYEQEAYRCFGKVVGRV